MTKVKIYQDALFSTDERIPQSWKILIDAKIFEIPGVVLAGGSVLPHYFPEHRHSDLDLFILRTPYVQDVGEVTEMISYALHRKGYEEFESSLTGIVKSYRKKAGEVWDMESMPIQVIGFMNDSIFDLFDSFDLCLCQVAYDGKVVIKSHKAKWDINGRKITVWNVKRPHNTLARIIKYSARGFNCDAAIGQFLGLLAMKLQNTDDESRFDVLTEYASFAKDMCLAELKLLEEKNRGKE